MEVEIDRGRCQGHGQCYYYCPEVFEPDDEGFGLTRLRHVPADLEAKAQRAADSCPEIAVVVR